VTFDRLEEPIGPRPPVLGREGKGAGMGRGGDRGGSKGKGKKKGHAMYRNSWSNCTDHGKMGATCLERKKKNLQGLCFYIYNPTRQAELKEGYMRQRHLGNKLWGPRSSVVHGHCLKPGRGTLALAI